MASFSVPELSAIVARLRRAQPRNPDTIAVCDALEERLRNQQSVTTAAPVTTVTTAPTRCVSCGDMKLGDALAPGAALLVKPKRPTTGKVRKAKVLGGTERMNAAVADLPEAKPKKKATRRAAGGNAKRDRASYMRDYRAKQAAGK